MKTALAVVAMVGGWTLAGAFLTPAAAFFGPDARMTDNTLVAQTRWVCDRRGNCTWRGSGRRTFYYGPGNWRHCEYRWRTGRRGPYRERLCW
ncbi:MAG: hypothetical protein K0S56_3323 [Microvirga sp.]|jgi:hypothetical protein|nr:hypothetical protein [Microvirga sp.]